MESYTYDAPPISFRDVTLLYSAQDQGWCDYVVKRFRCDQLRLRLELLSVDKSDSKDRPEIEMAVRASHVLVLFTTTNLLNYIEMKKDWFPPMLKKADPEVSTILGLTLGLNTEEIEQLYQDIPDILNESNRIELQEDAINITGVISIIIDLVDVNTEKKAQRDEKKRRKSKDDSKTSVQIIPENIQKVGEKMALLFKQEIKGEVTVNFNHQKDNVLCELVNPYCAVFTVPEISLHESHIIVQIDIDGVKYKRQKLKNAQVTAQFSSIDLLCQSHGVTSRDELDKLLANQFMHSLCSDPLAMRIFETPPSGNYPSERAKQKYPTMLHWAAAHGLKELTSALLSAPGATLASQVDNVNNDDPIDLAKKNGYNELSKFIYEFLEAQELANTCDLYIQCASLEQEQEEEEGLYEEMTAPGSFRCSSQTASPGVVSGAGKPVTTGTPPPLPPPRTSRNNSSASTGEIPSPKELFFGGPQTVPLPLGALGSRSQTELIEIQEEVKRGNFSIEEAGMLFRSWKERYMTGNAVSFRERQQGLKAFQDEHSRAVQLHRKINRGNRKKSKSEESPQTAIDISDPILKRKNTSGKRQVGAGRGDSTNSNVSYLSLDSGRDSSVSVTSQASFSSDDCEYHNPEDESGPGDMQLRSPYQSGRRESSKANRQSMKDMYLSLVEESDFEGVDTPLRPPPIPPRSSMPKAPPIPGAMMKSRTLSHSALPIPPPPKPQVFVRRGSSLSSNSAASPVVAPRTRKK